MMPFIRKRQTFSMAQPLFGYSFVRSAAQPVGFFTAYGQVARDAAAGKIDYNIVSKPRDARTLCCC